MAAEPETSVTLASSWFGAAPAVLQDAIVRMLVQAGGVRSSDADSGAGSEVILVDARAAKRIRLSGVVARNNRRVRRNRSLVIESAELLAQAAAVVARADPGIDPINDPLLVQRPRRIDRRAMHSLRIRGVVAKNRSLIRHNTSLVSRNADHIAVAGAWVSRTRARTHGAAA